MTTKLDDSGVTFADGSILNAAPRSYLAGLTLSTAGASATMSIAAGQCTDSTNLAVYSLAAIAKTTAAWAVGTAAGGLDTGTVANSTWYHFHVIRRPDTGATDVLFSLSATAPTLPASYTQFRRIGSSKTNGSAQWTAFVQRGNEFAWLVPVADVTASSPGTAAVSYTLSVPTGVNVLARLNVLHTSILAAAYVYLSDLATTDTAAGESTNLGIAACNVAGGDRGASYMEVFTNTASQIRGRFNQSDGNTILRIGTLGWSDTRGRDA